MAKPSPTSGTESPVTRLLTERDQYSQWLNRLGVTDDTIPEAVRGKVRADYEARLAGVVEQLKLHADQVTQQLTSQRARLDALVARESAAQEKLAEAELRHAVGEYDEAQWQRLRGETHRNLVSVREESGQIVEEISRLDEVARLISAPPAPAPAAPPPGAVPAMGTVAVPAVKRPAASPPPPQAAKPAPASAPDIALEPVDEGEAAPAPTAKGTKPPRDSARTLFFPSGKGAEKGVDELDFLKSVGGEGDGAARKERAAKPAAVKEGPPAAAEPATAPAAEPAEAVKPKDTSGAKTLKCAECGTMNRATEWYCERCGAELAAL